MTQTFIPQVMQILQINYTEGISSFQEKKESYLPSLVCSAIVRVVFCDVGIDATESQLLVWS